MAVAELLAEIQKPEYAGKSDAEILAALNEWHTTYTHCAASSLRLKFAELLLPARVAVAHDKGTIDDNLWMRWVVLLEHSENDKNGPVLFNVRPLFIEDLFTQLSTLEVITPTELIWLLDLGRRQTNRARKVYSMDVTQQHLDGVRDPKRVALVEKVQSRRVEMVKLLEDVEATNNEVQKRDGQGNPIGDVDITPPWELKATDVVDVEIL